MAAMPVGVEVARPVAVAETSTYVASIQSRDSMVISPLVGGILRGIAVRSGERVAQGAALMQIDPTLQQAVVENLENQRAALAATLSFDATQLGRMQKLYQEKIGTQQDYQQAQSTYNSAKAQADSLDAQIRQARTTLGYYRVTAPRAGVVGDIPVKVGDQVTTGTALTTLDSPSGLEVYVQVPIEQEGKLRTGLAVEVLSGEGAELARTRIYFVSPQVDYATQSVLAKARLPEAAGVRTQQYVQARITWGEQQAVLVPVLAVVRLGGGTFLDLAQPQGDGYVVRQAEVTLGAIEGNNVEVTAGLKAGERVIVTSTQILAEGMPVAPMAAGPAGRGR
ncbi:MAG TPA: efflux RND transporter periplasmic adaptor subunit [Terriglobales bacterium]|nr:efflux RND transporter periplasmic adaptor subunit [Terriglobales bacterium]